MAELVVNGADITCPMGKPGTAKLVVMPTPMVMSGNQPVATVQDHKPMANIPTFGMCTTLENPQVKAATAAAQGVLTPQPCLPIVDRAWSPGSSTVKVDNKPALTRNSSCMCKWGGKISIINAGQQKVAAG